MHTTQKIIIYIALTAILFFAFGFLAAGLLVNPSAGNLAGSLNVKSKDSGNTFQAGWDAARQKLEESGYIMASEVNTLSGSVKQVENGKLVLGVNLFNPLDDEILKERTAMIGETTVIEIQKEKTAEERKAEESERGSKLAQLRNQLKTAADDNKRIEIEIEIMNLEMPVDFFKLEKAGISDIKTGSNVSVTAEEDIAQKLEFTASRIILYPGMAEPDMAETDMPPTPETPETLEAIE